MPPAASPTWSTRSSPRCGWTSSAPATTSRASRARRLGAAFQKLNFLRDLAVAEIAMEALAVCVAMAALIVLAVVFDSLMVSVDLFRYDAGRTLGIDVLLARSEDLTWPIASALLLPSLWALSGERLVGRRLTGSDRDQPVRRRSDV